MRDRRPRPAIRPVLSTALLALALVLAASACGDDAGTQSGRITAQIVSITPSAGFVPAAVELVADFEAVDDVDPSNVRVSWDFGDGAGSSGTFTVNHTYQQAGTYTVVVTMTEVRGDGSTRSESEAEGQVVVYPQADLRATTPVLSERAARSSDPLRATFDMFNDASEVPVPFEVGIYLARPGVINPQNPPDATLLANLALSGSVYLIAGQSFDSFGGEGSQTTIDIQDFTVPCPGPPSSEYEPFAYVDSTGIVGEFDETNNFALASETLDYINTCSQGPDLVVNDVRARPSRSNALETVTFNVEIGNPGTDQASQFAYEAYLSYLNTELEPADLLIASGNVDLVPANGQVDLDPISVTLDEPQSALGNYYVLVVVDTEDDVTEANEQNNIGFSNILLVTDEPIPGVDLIPTNFSFDPATSFLDGSLTLRVSVLNQGDEAMPAGGFFCRTYLSDDNELDEDDDIPLQSINFRSLGANEELEEEEIALIPGFFDPGFYYLIVFCDPTFRINEADEDNNVLAADGRLEISTDPEIDLRFESFSVAPTSVENEADVTINARVCNDGTNGAGPSVMRVWISADGLLQSTDTLLYEHLVRSVNADDCIDISEAVPAVCDTFQPTYTVFAELDVSDLLPETNEDNNQATVSPFTIEGVICQCDVDALENNATGSNNSPSTPTFVSARTYEALTMCDLARDWYAIPLQRGETVRAVITFDGSRGNLDMQLYAANRATILDTSTSNGDREEVIAFVVPEDGDYLLKVFGRSDPTNSRDANAYNMTITITPAISGIDLFATNVSLSNTAPVLAEAVDVTFDIVNIGDTPAGASVARIYLSEDVEVNPALDSLLGEVPFAGIPGASSIRRATFTVNMPATGAGGDRYIAVVADATNTVPGEIDETNNAGFSDVFELNAGCFDPLEPNNTKERARDITLTGPVTTATGLTVCSDNRDFYRICGLSGDFLRMRTQFDGETYDVDMRLYNNEGGLLQRADGTGSEEVIEVDFLAADRCFLLEVLVVGPGREAPYDLIIETGDAPPELVCSSVGEPNDTFATAARLGDLFEAEMAVCPVTDVDYYFLNVSSGTHLEFYLEPGTGASAVPADLRMSFWSPSHSFLANSVSATEPLVFTTIGTGRHYLRVTSITSGPRNQRYRIRVEGLDGRDLQPLDYRLEPGIIGAGERVQYNANIVNNRVLASGIYSYGVYLSDDPVITLGGDTQLQLVSMPSLDGGGLTPISGRVTIPAGTAGGLHFLGIYVDTADSVDEFEELNNIALLPLEVLSSCVRDGAEPNDFRTDWAALEDFTGQELFLCPDDDDWFRLTVPSGQNRTVSAAFNAPADQGDLDLVIEDQSGVFVAEGVSTSHTSESVTFTAPTGGFVYVHVDTFGLTNFPYTLTVSP